MKTCGGGLCLDTFYSILCHSGYQRQNLAGRMDGKQSLPREFRRDRSNHRPVGCPKAMQRA